MDNDVIIEFRNFSFQYYAQAEPTLHDINLKIHRGEKILIAGPSGSGKSTIAKAILGMVSVESGNITLCPAADSEAVAGIAQILGVEPVEVEPMIAHVKCAGCSAGKSFPLPSTRAAPYGASAPGARRIPGCTAP